DLAYEMGVPVSGGVNLQVYAYADRSRDWHFNNAHVLTVDRDAHFQLGNAWSEGSPPRFLWRAADPPLCQRSARWVIPSHTGNGGLVPAQPSLTGGRAVLPGPAGAH